MSSCMGTGGQFHSGWPVVGHRLPWRREVPFGWCYLQLWPFWKAANVPAAERTALKSERGSSACLHTRGLALAL